MEITNEMRKKAAQAASPAELAAMARAEGIALSDSDAERYYRFLHTGSELEDDDLEQVAGGKGNDDSPPPKYSVGQNVEVFYRSTANYTIGVITAVGTKYKLNYGYEYEYHVTAGRDCQGNSKPEDFTAYDYLESNPYCRVY